MSSTDDKTESGSQHKLNIEAFRHHLLNYRSKADESESDITYQFDLDSSFKRMLNEKRQMTNKENNPPAVEQSTSSTNPPEKPMRRDLLKERLRSRVDDSYMDQSSYVMENSLGSDIEFATINRLMADFNINRDTTFAPKRSPLKMLKITGDSLNDFGSSSQNVRLEDAETTFNTAHTRVQALSDATAHSSSTNADDTLEEIEYLYDRGLNYVPKRLIEEIQSKSETNELKPNESVKKENWNESYENEENDENVIQTEGTESKEKVDRKFDDEVIVVDSSPENSFISTQSTERFKSAVESIENTFHTAKADPTNVSILSIDSDSTINQSDDKLDKKTSTLRESGICGDESFELSSNTQNDATAASENDDGMPKFNDTLERVDYMMEQGQKLLNEKKALNSPIVQKLIAQPKSNKKTPLSQVKAKVLTPNSASLKKATPKHLTPNKVDMFKRPEIRNVRSPFATAKSASASKVQAAPINSRIPTKTGSLHKPKAQFRHIASPIAAYIKNTPEVPLMKTIKPMRNLFTEDYNKVCKPNLLDESTQSVESFPIKSALPRKMYMSAEKRHIIDNRWKVTPGGKTVHKLIGNQPLVIRHDGKVKTNGSTPVPTQEFEESWADLSVASGDVSVQVVQDVHRMYKA